MKRLLALVAVVVGWASASSAQFTSNCNQQGGYPWSQGACLNASDLNNAQELSISGTPPGNISGQGANQGKLWLDTSGSPTKLRQCRVPVCSSDYVASQWRDWMPVDANTDAIDWPIGGGATTIAASGVLDIGLYPQAVLTVTGAATINSFGPTLPAGQAKILLFTSASTIVYGANSIVTPTGGNITTSAGGIALVVAQGGGRFNLAYQPQVGTSPGGAANAFQFNAGSGSFGGTSVVNNAVACTDGSGTPGECRTLPGGLTYPSPVFPSSGIALAGPLITGLPNPTASDQPANKGYVDAAATGFFPHQPVTAATAAALPNSPTYSNGAGTLTAGANAALVVDGLTISTPGTRVLVQNEAVGAHNGIFTLTTAGSGSVPWVLTRAADFNTAAAGNIAFGASVLVGPGGTANFSTSWTMNTTGAITVGTTALNWVQTSAPGAYTADNTSLQLSGSTFGVKPGGTFPTGLTIPGYLPVTGGLVANTQLAPMSAHTYKGNVGSSSAAPSDLTRPQLTADLNPCTSTLQGVVPAPPNDPTMVLDGVCAWRSLVTSCPSILQYGGVRDGVTDNSAAWAAALAASPPAHRCVYFPAGVYAVASPLAVNLPTASQGSITVKGDGIDTTEIRPAGNGFAFVLNGAYQSFHVQNMSIVTSTPCSGCTAIAATLSVGDTNPYNSSSDITNLAIFGLDRNNTFPSGNDYFQTGVDINGVSNIAFNNLFIQGINLSSGPAPGTGVYIHGSGTTIPVVFNFVNSNINLYAKGIDYGPWTQGVTIGNSNLVGDQVGVYLSSAAGQGASQLAITNSSINACAAIYVPEPASNASVLNGLLLANDYFILGNQPWSCGAFKTGISLGKGTEYPIIVGNIIGGFVPPVSGEIGIQTSGISNNGGKISQNMFTGFDIAVDTTDATTTPTGLLIDGNTFNGNNTGIRIGATTQYATVSNNLLVGNTTGIVNNALPQNNFIDIPQDCSGVSGLGISFNLNRVGQITSSTYCRYKVVNRRAFIDFDYTLTAKGSSTGAAQVQLPLSPIVTNPISSGVVSYVANMAGLTGAVCGIMAGGLLELFQQNSAGCSVPLTDGNITNTTRIAGAVQFEMPYIDAE